MDDKINAVNRQGGFQPVMQEAVLPHAPGPDVRPDAAGWQNLHSAVLAQEGLQADEAELPDNARNYVYAVYALYGAGVFSAGLTCIAGVIIAYMKLDDMAGSYYRDHLAYLIKTFWIGFAATLVSALLSAFGIGLLLLLVAAVWFVYRVVLGFMKLLDRKTVLPHYWF